jgi:hypothetical protein
MPKRRNDVDAEGGPAGGTYHAVLLIDRRQQLALLDHAQHDPLGLGRISAPHLQAHGPPAAKGHTEGAAVAV